MRRRLVGLLAASLTLAACGAGGTPSAARTSSPEDSAPESTASPTPTATVQAPGTVLTSSSGDGSVTALAAQGGGFSLLQGRHDAGAIRWTLTPYDVAGNQLISIQGDAFSGECGAADVSPDGQRLIITAQLETQPAQGVMAARYSESLTAFDAGTGEKVWTSTVVPPQASQLTCNSADAKLQGFSATLDGRWGALRVQAGDRLVASAIDLSSGQVLARPDLLGALGNWLVTGTRRHVYGVADPSSVAVPPSWAALGAFSNATIPMDMPAEAVTGRFPVDDAQNPPSTGLSSDGTVLFTR
ncbi:MAG: hypothetical protein ACXVGE_19375, partial [Blastococcus sp.]